MAVPSAVADDIQVLFDEVRLLAVVMPPLWLRHPSDTISRASFLQDDCSGAWHVTEHLVSGPSTGENGASVPVLAKSPTNGHVSQEAQPSAVACDADMLPGPSNGEFSEAAFAEDTGRWPLPAVLRGEEVYVLH